MKVKSAQLVICGKMLAHHFKEADNLMGWFILTQLFSTLIIQLIRIGRMSDQEKDLEIMILRYQLDMAERKLQTPLKPTRAEKLTLAGVTAHTDGFWVAQQARQYVWTLEENEVKPRFLIHDNNQKFIEAHDTVFQSERIRM
jgi:hypothetical protein